MEREKGKGKWRGKRRKKEEKNNFKRTKGGLERQKRRE